MRNISFSENSKLFDEAIELKKQLNTLLHEKALSRKLYAVKSRLRNEKGAEAENNKSEHSD